MEALELSPELQLTQFYRQKNRFPLSHAELGTMQLYYHEPQEHTFHRNVKLLLPVPMDQELLKEPCVQPFRSKKLIVPES